MDRQRPILCGIALPYFTPKHFFKDDLLTSCAMWSLFPQYSPSPMLPQSLAKLFPMHPSDLSQAHLPQEHVLQPWPSATPDPGWVLGHTLAQPPPSPPLHSLRLQQMLSGVIPLCCLPPACKLIHHHTFLCSCLLLAHNRCSVNIY